MTFYIEMLENVVVSLFIVSDEVAFHVSSVRLALTLQLNESSVAPLLLCISELSHCPPASVVATDRSRNGTSLRFLLLLYLLFFTDSKWL